MWAHLKKADPEIWRAIAAETKRQHDGLELIASENYPSLAVLEAMSSVFNNKYAEGYPGRRYYGGCENADTVENLARDRAKELFGAEHANVQPHAGSQANMSVYFTALDPGDTFLGMSLDHGGHLSHGHRLSFSGKWYNVFGYGLRREDEIIDWDALERQAAEKRPKLIVVGASAYSRTIDFARARKIADGVGAMLMADIAHIAGPVAAGLHPSPFPHAQFVTTTTHKTLRGPRGGLVMCEAEHAKALDRSVFPGLQGGPLVHVIAAKAIAFQEALTDGFRDYQRRILENARGLAADLAERGYRIVSGGTDNHMFLVDLTDAGLDGKEAEATLEEVGITVNKNAIPFDPRPPLKPSGIRIGTPAITARGMGRDEMTVIAEAIDRALKNRADDGEKKKIAGRVRELADGFAVYPELQRALA